MSLIRQIKQDNPAILLTLNEPYGATTAVDGSGNGRNGSYTGSVITPAGRSTILGVSPDFAGGYVAVTDNSAYSAAGSSGILTVEAWVYLDSVSLSAQMIVSKWSTSGSNAEWDLRIQSDGTPLFNTAIADGSGSIWSADTVGPAITASRLYHLVGTYDRGAPYSKLYVNGVLVSTQTTVVSGRTMSDGSGTLEIGHRGGGGGTVADGTISHVAVYSTALASDRIKAHYDAGITSGVMV